MTEQDPFAPPPAGYQAPPAYGQPAPGYPPAQDQQGMPPAYGQGTPPGYGQPFPGQAVPATPWRRLGAGLLNALLFVVTLGIGYLVWAMVLWQQGTNPAKKMLGMKIISTQDGRTLDWGQMFVRNFVFGGLVVGLLGAITLYIFTLVDAFMSFGEKRQRLIDKWSNSLVIMA